MPANVARQVPSLSSPTHPIIRLVAGFSRLLLNRWCASVEVRGLDRFLGVLHDEERRKRGRGILTYANHISVLDDPTIFGALPRENFQLASMTRWTLGASDIMFTNRFLSKLFSSGQVLPTDRGRGVFQPALDRSLNLLETGHWVHMFPEGYVNLSRKARLRRFKWGVGRILLEAGAEGSDRPRPLVVPMWISGLDAMMPEPRANPRWFPRPGAKVMITFGDAINATLEPLLSRLTTLIAQSPDDILDESTALEGLSRLSPQYPSAPSSAFPPPTPLVEPPGGVPWPVPLPKSRSANAVEDHADSVRARAARSLIAAELRAHLAQLGEQQGGDLSLVHKLMEEESDSLNIQAK